MMQFTLDAAVASKLHELFQAAELCDPRSQMRKLGAYLEKVAGLRRREPAA